MNHSESTRGASKKAKKIVVEVAPDFARHLTCCKDLPMAELPKATPVPSATES